MPKFIENYKLEPIENLSIDEMEHYIGKQNGSGKLFILKRFKSQSPRNAQSSAHKSPSPLNQDLFQKLTHQTLILKNISHSSIPKCVRMLKTSNSIYFVWQYHSQMPIQEYLHKSWLKIEEKIQIALNIIEALIYLHRKNIAHREINSQNVKIDEKRQIFLTNFKESFKLESDMQIFKIQQQIIKQKQFQNFIFGDVYDAAVLLFQIFQFKKINPKFHVFTTNSESRLFRELSDILERKIQSYSLDNLRRILSQKVSVLETACTEASENIPSPTVKSVIKRSIISRDSDLDKSLRNLRSSVSCSKTTLHKAMKRAQVMRNEMNVSRKSQKCVSSQLNKTTELKARIQPKVQIAEKSISKYSSELKKIIRNRKLINFLLECLKFVGRPKYSKLIYLLGIKCGMHSDVNRRLIEECSSNHLEKKEMDFLKILNSENMKTQDIVYQIKSSIKAVIKESFYIEDLPIYQAFDQAAKRRDVGIIEKNLSKQIYEYLQNEIYSQKILEQKIESTKQYSTSPELRPARKQGRPSKDLIRTQARRAVSIMESFSVNENLNYEDYKFYYYLSIQLKYGSFERFFEAEVASYNDFKVLRSPHFLPFQNKLVPVKQIALEVKYRIQKYIQKMSI